MKNNWQFIFRQPENPNKSTWNGTLASGSSPNAQFIFDAIYDWQHDTFVLTLLQINNELGFIENEKRLYLNNWHDLRMAIEQFMQSPHAQF